MIKERYLYLSNQPLWPHNIISIRVVVFLTQRRGYLDNRLWHYCYNATLNYILYMCYGPSVATYLPSLLPPVLHIDPSPPVITTTLPKAALAIPPPPSRPS